MDRKFCNAVSDQLLSAFPGDEPLLAGVSGGVDSMVLLDLLVPLFGSRLIVCHVNHGLRGEASDGDQLLVEEAALGHRLECLSAKGDVAALAGKKGISIELAAREFRYNCFHAWAEQTGARTLFLAHHANDQAETILFNLCRGGGGLRGMSRSSTSMEGLRLVRPLLGISKADILQYAQEKGIQWREDHTNGEPVAARNRIRLEVMPLLDDLMNRPVAPQINQAAEISMETSEALEAALEALDLLDPQGRLYLPKVWEFPPCLKKAAIHWYLVRCGVSGISSGMVEQILGLLDIDGPAKVNLPGNRYARRKEKRLIVE